MKRVAFTLMELLMVVAILGLLMGMLLPSVFTALEFPRRAHCLDNLKQMGQAFYGYQGANNDYMPPFCSVATNPYDWIWPDTLAPYISGKPSGPGVESGGPVGGVATKVNYPGKSIWACPDAKPNPYVSKAYGVQYPRGGFRTNYANTCGGVSAGGWQPAPNNAGLIMTDGHRQSSAYDSYRICNRYNQMDGRSIVVFCGCYGCDADAGFPDPASLPSDWNQNGAGSVTPGQGVIIIPFAHLKQTPALTVNGGVKTYPNGVQMGGDPNGNDTNGNNTWVPVGSN